MVIYVALVFGNVGGSDTQGDGGGIFAAAINDVFGVVRDFVESRIDFFQEDAADDKIF